MSTATQTQPTVNLVAKSQLARLLATENMTIMHSTQARTASFDTNKRTLILPVWSKASEDLYDMLVAHEVGHALHTPAEDVYMPICERVAPQDPKSFFPFLNIVEDVRVDAAIKDSYPGVRRSYFNAFKELMEMDFFGVKSKNVSDMSLGDRINLYTKAGQYGFIDVPFTAGEQAIVDEVLKVKTFDDVAAVAEKIYNYSEQEEQEEQGDGEDASPDQRGSGSSQGNGNNPSDDEQEGDEGSEGESSTGNNSDNTGGQSKMGSVPASGGITTTQTLDERLADLASHNHCDGYEYYDMPRINLDSVIFDVKRMMDDTASMRADTNFCGYEILSKIESRNKDFVANLVKQFEQKMAADAIRRTRTAKSGRLDMRKIANYKFSDDLFIKNQTTSDGKNHGMIFLMDWSGSMSDYLMPTVEQMIALCLFCRKMNIPFEVYAFTNSMPNIDHNAYSLDRATLIANSASVSPDYTTKNGVYGIELDTGSFLRLESVGLINFLSSRLNNQDFKTAAATLCQIARNNDWSGSDLAKEFHSCNSDTQHYNLSGTPLNEAMFLSIPIIQKFKAANRLDIVNTIVLTDGGAGSSIAPRGDWRTARPYNRIINLPNREQFPLRQGLMEKFNTFAETEIETFGLANLVRHMTGSNMISIRLASKRDLSYITQQFAHSNQQMLARLNADWKENNFFSVKGFGYDETFVIDSKTEVMDTDDVLANVKDDASIGVITRAFIKNNAKRASSRVLLSRFSDLIAKKILA